jgi:site-specific DNA-methyltransferase (adenine-specific)
MGKDWDAFVPQPLFWKEAFRVLKHGGHVLSFFGTRTYDWGVMAMRFAGFEVRDTIVWNYGSGFPKSHNIINILKNELKCKVEKVNVNAAIMNLSQQRKVTEMDGQDIVIENVLVKVKKEGYLEFVKIVPKNFTFQMDISKDKIEDNKEIFALLNVELNGNQKTSILKIILIGKEENLLEKMDTLQLTWEKENIDLNTILLWKNITEQKFQLDKMFTILMELEPTIELKICNYFLNQNIQSYITNNHSALKPASELIVLARKPLEKGLSIAENVIKWGVGGINIDGCRIGTEFRQHKPKGIRSGSENYIGDNWNPNNNLKEYQGRFPANVIFSHHEDCVCNGTKKVKAIKGGNSRAIQKNTYNDFGKNYDNTPNGIGCGFGDADGNEEVEQWDCVEFCPIRILDEQSGVSSSIIRKPNGKPILNVDKGWNNNSMIDKTIRGINDKGGASRFFYTAKSSKGERNKGLDGFEDKQSKKFDGGEFNSASTNANERTNKNFHPTVKPIKLMQYLVRLITPPNGIVLDPFNGSGTTGIAAKLEGFNYVGLELDPEYCKISEARIAAWEIDKLEIDNQLSLF